MKSMELDKTILNNEYNDDIDESDKLKPIISKNNIFRFLIFLLFLGLLIIVIVLFVFQLRQINKLNAQIKDITNQFDEEYLKNKTSYLSMLNNKINNTETKILQNINNLNKLINDNMDTIEKNLEHKNDEIELLKNFSNDLNDSNKIIINNINNIKTELTQKTKEIDIFSNNFSKLNDKVNNNIEIKVNKNSDDIQDIKNIESNLSLLIDFKVKVRIKAIFFIDDQQAQICSHKLYEKDYIDDSRIRLNAFKWEYGGCVWIMHQNGKFFEFTLTDSSYEMNDWKIQINNNDAYCTNIGISSIFILEEGSINKYYKIKSNETGKYLYINKENKRDDLTFFIDLTENKDLATDFRFEIYHE